MLDCDSVSTVFSSRLAVRPSYRWIRYWRGAIAGKLAQWRFGRSIAPDLLVRREVEERGTSSKSSESSRKGIRRFSLIHDPRSGWTLTGTATKVPAHFADLAIALSFARADAGGGEAEIELWVDGFYIFVHQTEGWPHPICAPSETSRHR